MGCDIHGVWEVRVERGHEPGEWVQWQNAGDISDDRSYHRFTILAGVRRGITEKRGDEFAVIAEPRGIPKDAGETARCLLDYESGLHSVSWVTLAELVANGNPAIQGLIDEGALLRRDGRTDDQIRMVFGFDS